MYLAKIFSFRRPHGSDLASSLLEPHRKRGSTSPDRMTIDKGANANEKYRPRNKAVVLILVEDSAEPPKQIADPGEHTDRDKGNVPSAHFAARLDFS
jgi:hypothetical protein